MAANVPASELDRLPNGNAIEGSIARLAALVPEPRAHLRRNHGVLALASPNRARVVSGIRAAAENSRDIGEFWLEQRYEQRRSGRCSSMPEHA